MIRERTPEELDEIYDGQKEDAARDNVVRIKRKPRPLQATHQPDAPYVVEREDQEDGSIRYMVFDHRPETYRYVCSTNDDGGEDGCFDSNAKRDAELIARGLNLLVQYGLERG